MKKHIRTIDGAAKHLSKCLTHIIDTFSPQYPHTEVCEDNNRAIIYVRNVTPWNSGKYTLKHSVGLNICVQLSLIQDGKDLTICVEHGLVIDKTLICCAGVCLPYLFPIIVTSCYGMHQQNKLCKLIFDEVCDFLSKATQKKSRVKRT